MALFRRSVPVATAWVRGFSRERPRDEPVDTRFGHGRGWITLAEGGVWVIHALSRTIIRLEPETLAITDILRLGKLPLAIAYANGGLWVLSRNGWLWRVDARSPRAEGVARLGRNARALGADGANLWALHDNGRLTRLDVFTGDVVSEGSIGASGRHLLVTPQALWATCTRPKQLVRIDPSGQAVMARVRLPGRAVDLTSFGENIWALSWEGRRGRSGSMLAAEAVTGDERVVHRIPGRPQAAVAADNGIFVASAPPGMPHQTKIYSFDPASGRHRPGVPKAGWCIDQLAVTPRWLLATMSTGTSRTTGGDVGPWAFDAGSAGGGGGDGGGWGGG